MNRRSLAVFDLSRMPDEQVRGTAILRIVLLTLKYISSEELVTKIDTIIELFKEVKDDQEVKEYVRSFSYYVEHAAREEIREMEAHNKCHKIVLQLYLSLRNKNCFMTENDFTGRFPHLNQSSFSNNSPQQQ